MDYAPLLGLTGLRWKIAWSVFHIVPAVLIRHSANSGI
jgi:hypothetical protein